jgi:hypothetical protein
MDGREGDGAAVAGFEHDGSMEAATIPNPDHRLRPLYCCRHWPTGRSVACEECHRAETRANIAKQQAQFDRDSSDLSSIVLAEAARQVELAHRELRRREKVYEALKAGDMRSITVRDMRLLLQHPGV